MKAKRFLSILVAVLMLVSCFAIGASAAGVTKPATGNLRIHLYENATDLGLTTGDLTGTASDLDTSNGKTYTGIQGVKFNVVRVADNAADVATAVALTGNDAYSTVTAATNADGDTTAENLPAGRYKVTVNEKPSYVGNPVEFLVDVPMTNAAGTGYNENVDVYPKISVTRETPSVDKEVAAVVGGEEGTYSYCANLEGTQQASWRITAYVPENIREYSKYVITDTVNANLDVVANSLTINGKAGTTADPFDEFITSAAFSGKTLTITVDPSKATPGSNIVIKFRTTFASSFVTYDNAGDQIPNHVTLTYNDKPDGTKDPNPEYDPDTNPDVPKEIDHPDDTTNNWKDPDDYNDGDTPDGDTPGENYDPYVWTGALEAVKVDNTGSVINTNEVQFELYKADKTTKVGTTQTTVNGKAYWTGLANGTYYLYETKAPAGYELNPNPVTVVIGENGVVKVTKNFENIPSTKLPLTGGMGVGMFALIGFAFAAAGSAFFFKSKKVSD